jgi:hypothetical protein
MAVEHPPEAQLEHVLAALKQAEPLFAVSELTWFNRLEAQAEAAQAALAWALREERWQEGLELSVLMARYWWVLGCRSDGRAWLSAFLADVQDADAELVEQAQAWLLELAGEDEAT